MTKRFLSTIIAVFALAMILAVSSFAGYGVNLYGNVTGLENGVSYTYAKYDFATDSYGEFTELTAATQLTAGVWGIKAGDAEPVHIHAQGLDSGYMNFFDRETGLPQNDIFGGKLDDYIPGKWTISTDGIYYSIARYTPSQEILLNVLKEKFNVQADKQTEKTVTLDAVAYPVYLIGEAEYYLKGGVYYAVADNAVFEGDATGAEQVFNVTKSWANATPLIGEGNKLQESVVRYGFTNEQVVPAKDVTGFNPEGLTPKTGAMFFNTKADGTAYTPKDIKGTLTYVVKVPGSAEETRYTIEINDSVKKFGVPAELNTAEGYLVAIEYAPYALCPDDIFNGHPTDESNMCYAYINLYSGDNYIGYAPVPAAAPEGVIGGYGTIYIPEGGNYEIAPVVISEDGKSLVTAGDWESYSYNKYAERNLAGLYAVREAYNGVYSAVTYAYAYGDQAGRDNIGHIDEATTRVAVTGTTIGFSEGYWTGKSGIATHGTFGTWSLGTLGGHISATDCNTLKNALAAETPDEATITAARKTIADKFNGIYYRYAYTGAEMVKTSEAESFTISFNLNNGMLKLAKISTRVVAYVADINGVVTPYTYTFADVEYKEYGTITHTINFAQFLPAEGVIVGLDIYPATNFVPEDIISVTTAGNARFLLNVNPANYTVAEAAGLPVGDFKPTGLKMKDGKLVGLDPDEVYLYTSFSLHGYEDAVWTEIPAGSTDADVGDIGIIAVKIGGDGYSYSESKYVYVYVGGSSNNILHLTTKPTTNTQKTVTVSGTKYNVFAIDGVEYYLNGDKYYAVADNSEYTGENAASATKVMTTKDVPDVVSLANTDENTYNIKFNAGKWSGLVLNNNLALTYSFDALVLGTSSTPIYSTLATAINTAATELAALGEDATKEERVAAETKLANARAAAAKKSNAIYYSYEYLPEEYIRMSDLNSYTFGVKVRQGGFKLVGTTQTKLVLKVATDDGEIEDRVAYKTATYSSSGTTHTFTLADFEKTDGYIVGIVIHPYVLSDGSYFNYSSKTNGDYNVYLKSNGYNVTRTFEYMEPPVVNVEGSTVSGLDADLRYAYGLYSMTGVVGDWTVLEPGITSFTHDLTGLVAVKVLGDGVNYSDSFPVVHYVPGPASARKTLGVITDGKPAYKTSTVWIPGTWTGDYLSWHDQTSGAYSFLDQSTGVVCADVETLWLYQVTKEEAEARLNADAANETVPASWTSNKITSNPARLQAVIDSHYEAADYEDTLAVNKLAHQTKVANAFAQRNIAYALDETEIIPVDELLSISFTSKKRQGGFTFTSVKSKAVFHVMDEDAKVTKYEWWSDEWAVTSAGVWKRFDVDVQSIEGLPSEGWIVGIEFYPWADVAPETIVATPDTRVDASNIAYSFGQQHVCIGYYYNDYNIFVPTYENPVLTAEDGVISGLDANATYEYGRFTADGIESTATVTGVTELALDPGVWRFKATSPAGDYLESDYVVVYNKDMTTARESILHYEDFTKSNGTVIQAPVVASAGSWTTEAIGKAPVFNEGKWTGYSLSHALLNYSFSPLTLGTTSCTIGSGAAAALIKNATTDEALAAARATAANALASIYYSYEYTGAEAIPMSEFVSWSFKSAERQGSLKVTSGSLQTKFVFKVVTEAGEIVDRVVYKDAKFDGGGSTINISINDFAQTDGYIVGIVIYPYGNCPEGTVIDQDGGTTAEDILVVLTDNYIVIPAQTGKAEAPVLSLNNNGAVITVTNYNETLDYVYSADGGNTWTAFEGNTFTASAASTDYIVKSLETEFFLESDFSAPITSPELVLKGASLVLDGQIGLKVYMDIDSDNVREIYYYTTKVNSDYKNATGDDASKYRMGGYISFAKNVSWMTNVCLDEATGLYYTIFYVPAKDIDNTNFETQLDIYLTDGTKKTVSTVGFRFTTYIEQAKALAAAGNQEFVEALALVEALENYTAYADAYFLGKTMEEYRTQNSTANVAFPSKEGALEGVQFAGTSILLQDQVTIRHYFLVNDLSAFNAKYGTNYNIKGSYIYYDITDISAQDIGELQVLQIKDLSGNVAFTVKYSVANYIVSMMNDTDANLVNLVNVMYDYYLAAADYNK